nr:MAG TPA: hypothetical protein [Microviridae sp.]
MRTKTSFQHFNKFSTKLSTGKGVIIMRINAIN